MSHPLSLHAGNAAVVRALAASTATPSAGGGNVQITWGVITTVTTGPPAVCSVTIRAAAAPVAGIRHLASYSPVVGDTVLLIEWPTATGEDRVILGTLA